MTHVRTPSKGDVLDGRYVLQRVLGQGGMGMVMLAEQINLGRKVAIKVLAAGLADAKAQEYEARFRREALAISRLYHPNIVQVMDYGRDPALGLYLVMEFLDGLDMGQLKERQSPLEPDRVADLLIQVLAALEAAHASQLLHRDIKPANIMACNVPGRPDFVKVLDFGIARALAGGQLDDMKLTREGSVCGTPTYMAPEQALGHPLDVRADVYSVAAILYELLVDQLPFGATTPTDYLVQKVQQDAPFPALRADGVPVPDALASICHRGMARKPEHRYPDAPAFREALETWLRRRRREQRSVDGSAALKPRPEAPVRISVLETSGEGADTRTSHHGPGPSLDDDEADLPNTWADLLAGSTGAAPVLQRRPTGERCPMVSWPDVGETLVGRDDVVTDLGLALDATRRGGWSAHVVVGTRGSGRTRVLREIGQRAALAGWGITTGRVTAEHVSPFLTPIELLAPDRGDGPRLVLFDDLDRLPDALLRSLLDPLLFADRPTLLLGSCMAPLEGAGDVVHHALQPLAAGQRLALAGGLLVDRSVLGAPATDYPAWLQHRLCMDAERSCLQWDGERWQRTGTPTLADIDTTGLVLQRLADLGDQHGLLVRLLALSPLGLEDAALPLPEEGEDITPSLEHLQRAGLADHAGSRWFAASLTVADAVRERLNRSDVRHLAAELADLHAHAALRSRGARRRLMQLQEAVLREAAAQPLEAAFALERTATQWMAVQHPERAVAPLRRAIGLARGEVVWTTDRIRMAAALAEAMTDAGRPNEALMVLDRIEIRPRLGPRFAALVALARGRAGTARQDDRADDALAEAEHLAAQAADPAIKLRSLVARAEDALVHRRREPAQRQLERAGVACQSGPLQPLLAPALDLAGLLSGAGDKDGARALVRRVIDAAEQTDTDLMAARGLLMLAGLRIERGDPKTAARYLDAVRSDPELEPILAARAALNRALLFTIMRDRDGAKACYREAYAASCAAGWWEGIEQARRALG